MVAEGVDLVDLPRFRTTSTTSREYHMSGLTIEHEVVHRRVEGADRAQNVEAFEPGSGNVHMHQVAVIGTCHQTMAPAMMMSIAAGPAYALVIVGMLITRAAA